MNRNILRSGAALVAAVLLTTLTVPAQASAGPNPGRAVQAIAPPAPAAAASLAAAPSPSIYPAVTVKYIRPDGGYGCDLDYLCALAWEPNYLWVDGQGGARLGGWAIFYLYNCREYELSNWLGDGYYLDNQRPAGLRGVRSYFRNQFHNQIGSYITPDGTQHGPYDWNPVWYIKNC
ncbi:hypothetical protein ACFQFC_10425 [Amorphoplanes digitatis]|uniref:Peptidase inhibitor family I36 n=1 Tax=Actinoplanes digitatis TaxID=1868 RepID=A0A7W7I1E9_9ACTN|nr:hypothetical protein [Actinoplanes digitatis]MBB4764612.1 hypothetical protein [Actinoplanes digitatis]GID91437.1 hypothetical protein Adi01nite_08490 [Actinoplanes digitatis]